MTSPTKMSNHSVIRPKDIRPAPAEIEYKNLKFLITDRPSDQTIQYYVTVSIRLIVSKYYLSVFCPSLRT